MSGVRGIAKNLSALFSSHALAVLQQVALVRLFIHVYGRAGYGEWLTMSAAVSYLGTLDFGVQTFVNQDLTVRYHRGEMEALHRNQSTALRMLLGIVGVAGLAATGVFALPMQHLLRMDGFRGDPVVAERVVQVAVFAMALQALVNILYGYFAGTFMVSGRAHVGAYWNNMKNLALIATALVTVLARGSFAVIALAQLGGVGLCLGMMLLHLRRAAPEVFPTLRHWDQALMGKILKPSGYFALITSSNFLVYQLPILILERTAGGAAVTLFSIMRTIFSMTRNLLNALTQAIGPEITRLYARRDWDGLGRLYGYSERMIFGVIPAVNLGVLFLCPFILTVWLGRREMFVPGIYLLSAAISIVMSAKEHKFQFQFSTNTHRELARFLFATYVGLGGMWMVAIPRSGVAGLLWCWLAVEVAQLGYLVRLNARLFRGQLGLDWRYLGRLGVLSAGGVGVAGVALPRTMGLGLGVQVGIAVLVAVGLAGVAVPMYGLVPVWGEMRAGFRRG